MELSSQVGTGGCGLEKWLDASGCGLGKWVDASGCGLEKWLDSNWHGLGMEWWTGDILFRLRVAGLELGYWHTGLGYRLEC